MQLTGGQEVEAAFPEALKGPILRKVQFQVVSRLDNLVDMVYDDFKQDYYPGEDVTVTMDGGDRTHGLVRDKTAFGPRTLPDGTQSRPMTRYVVTLRDSPQETMVTDEHICRDRGIFTKAMLRSFIKRTVIREAWNGAPWLVKHEYAHQYCIDTRIPPHLRYDTKLQERKTLQAQKRALASPATETNGDNLLRGSARLPELKPVPKGQKGKRGQANGLNGSYPENELAGSREHDSVLQEPSPPPPPPPPKYPIEDLQLEPRNDAVRPALNFMCRNPPADAQWLSGRFVHGDKIDMESTGPLLEIWDTLNVYCEIFKLDSFTFDDFVEALVVTSVEVPVQLTDEIHCSVLKILVDAENDGGKLRITLPELEEKESDNEDEDTDDEENSEAATPEPEPTPPARATRSSLAKKEMERLAAEVAAAEQETMRAELATRHRAEELLKDYDWIEHLQKRDFSEGGWERIVVGLLHQLSKDERQNSRCEKILLQLVPPEDEPSKESVRQNYAGLDVNSRVRLLQILCTLTIETKAFRGYMEECSETMTNYRKDKIEWQRQRKQA